MVVGGGRHNRGVVRSAPQGTTDATVMTPVGGGPHNPAVVASASHHQTEVPHASQNEIEVGRAVTNSTNDRH